MTPKHSTWHKKIKTFFNKSLDFINSFRIQIEQPMYRVISFEQDDDDESMKAVVQIVNTRQIFYMHPEEILASDKMTDAFSQRDIRALTYLGYLGINSPKYKILAKRLWGESGNNSKFVFAIKEKGKKKLIMKTAAEVFNDSEFIKNLDQKDAHMPGYTAATEYSNQENIERQKIIDSISQQES